MNVMRVEQRVVPTHVMVGLRLGQSPRRERIVRRGVDAHPGSAPPLAHVLVPPEAGVIVHERAQPTPELGVDEEPRAFPPEVLVVKLVVLADFVQVCGEFLGRREVVHVDV